MFCEVLFREPLETTWSWPDGMQQYYALSHIIGHVSLALEWAIVRRNYTPISSLSRNGSRLGGACLRLSFKPRER